MIELIKELIANLINLKTKEKKNLDLRHDLQVKFNRSLYLKEYLQTKTYQEFDRPKLYASLENGILNLIHSGPAMTELEIKTILSGIRANLSRLEDMRYAIEEGEKAGIKLEQMKP